jgi:hypothetical protein
VYEDPKYDSRWLSLGKETIMESIQLYSNHFIKKRRKSYEGKSTESRKGMDNYKWV